MEKNCFYNISCPVTFKFYIVDFRYRVEKRASKKKKKKTLHVQKQAFIASLEGMTLTDMVHPQIPFDCSFWMTKVRFLQLYMRNSFFYLALDHQS